MDVQTLVQIVNGVLADPLTRGITLIPIMVTITEQIKFWVGNSRLAAYIAICLSIAVNLGAAYWLHQDLVISAIAGAICGAAGSGLYEADQQTGNLWTGRLKATVRALNGAVSKKTPETPEN